jgi:chorismate mutase / prephenate dehydratase
MTGDGDDSGGGSAKIDLSALRLRIDAVDEQLLALLAERADLVADVAEEKRAHGLSTVDPERENALLRRLLALGAGRFPREAILAVFREIMSASVSLQATVTVAYLGPAGTFSHLAARTLFGYAPAYLEEATIEGVFDAVARGRATYGVVPLENSSEGSVANALDALLNGSSVIRREVVLPISHCLMARARGLTQIERVYSHPQALGQCRSFLASSLANAQLVHTASTAAAVQHARHDPAGAAIGSTLASELYGMPILAERIEDHSQNQTRFVMIGPDLAKPTGNDKTTLAFSIAADRRRGSLRRTLSCLDRNGVNMTRIESRPSRVEPWRYVFVVDVEGHVSDEPVARALEALREKCEWVRVLGSYPRYPEA